MAYNWWAKFTGWHVAEDNSDPHNYIRAVFDPQYYSYGSVRIAHKGQFTHPQSNYGKEMVVKVFKSDHANLKSDWTLDIETAEKAIALARKFNNLSQVDTAITFEDVIPLQVSSQSLWHETQINVGEWVVAEHFLHGDYKKWLSNNGWVSSDAGETLPAFSHWTWVESNGDILVCDLQGVYNKNSGYQLTDPAINSSELKYGKTDIGTIGIHNFFDSHICTPVCKSLGIDWNRPPKRKLRPSKNLVKHGSTYSGEEDVKQANKFVCQLEAIQEVEEEEKEEEKMPPVLRPRSRPPPFHKAPTKPSQQLAHHEAVISLQPRPVQTAEVNQPEQTCCHCFRCCHG